MAGNGAEGDRTLNLLDATEALSQLSYRPAEPDILAFPKARCHDFGASERYTVAHLNVHSFLPGSLFMFWLFVIYCGLIALASVLGGSFLSCSS